MREREAGFRRLIDVLPVAVYTVAAPAGVITFYNERAAQLWGRTPTIGDPEERFCGSFRIWRPDGTLVPHDHAPMAVAIREARSFRNEEVVIERPDGTRITALVNIEPLRDPGGAVVGAVNAFQDVTALTAAERAVAASEERFRSLVSIITDVPWTTDAAGAFVTPQHAWQAFTGQTWEEHRGYGWLAALHPDDQARIREIWQRALETGRLYETSGRVWNAARGAYRDFAVRATAIRNAHGAIREWVGSCTDVTESRAAEQRMHDDQRRKDEFLAMLAHELRNPLGAIQNAGRLLGLAGIDDARLTHAREIITRQTAHLTRLVDDLLDVSRITRGAILLQREPVSLEAVVRLAVELARPAIDRLGHDLRVEHANPSVRLEADFARLVQVVSNLLGNAAKFTPAGGRIALTTETTNGHVVLRVRDSGVGIEPALQATVFDLFVQQDTGLARTQGGLGIGLTLVRRIVELHGGTVVVRSEGTGAGSEFTVTLPIRAEVAAPTPPPVADAPRASRTPPVRVLVVEDNPDAAESLTLLLQLGGHEVRVAHDGFGALALVEDFAPDVGLIDVGLPGIDGYELAARLRAHQACRRSVLVALTGYGRDEDKHRATEVGFDHHLTKPVEFEAIDRLLGAAATRAKPRDDAASS